MFNFDNNHSFIVENINNKKGKLKFKKIIASSLVVTNIFSFSGCAKNIPCDIKDAHAHYYTSEDNLGRYIISERETLSGLTRSNDYIPISKEDEELLNFINKKDLFNISENKDAIENITKNQHDYKEYRYSYQYLIPITHHTGKSTYLTYIPATGHSWTQDINTNRDFTGEERDCHYMYYGYKIIKDDNGKYKLIKSDKVDDISLLEEGYEYITENFYIVVNLYNKDEELDYEDGSIDDKIIDNNIEENNKTK